MKMGKRDRLRIDLESFADLSALDFSTSLTRVRILLVGLRRASHLTTGMGRRSGFDTDMIFVCSSMI